MLYCPGIKKLIYMIKIALITLILIVVIGIYIPEKYLPKEKRKIRRSKYSDEYWTGLPWMGGKKKKRKDFFEF